ncbi:chemotaxis protein CheW [Parerythrobacter lacustris]|uniref:Chemotaxis protein CheW n=1 Tax=Parerythrobacter lacustris TaxID=2969984 RepID=A0ABT1XST3_9SPHN|nr:chemotaxis protein CheW [Parerythrobacter lacustris]MCR2834698.1 chemotaxis protein CheW [Parerythrobacter lacustris]
MSTLYVMIEIDGRLAAIDAADVQSVIEVGSIYPVPRAPGHIAGLTAMRSQSLTVIDCRKALGLPSQTVPERAPVVRVADHSYALMVDRVDDVLESRSEPAAVPGNFGADWQRAGRGMIETDRGPALLVNVEALIAGPRAKAA